MQLGFYFDQSRCSGCFTCVVACKEWHDIQAGPISYIRVNTIEQGQFPNLSASFLVNLCYHCLKPPCVSACSVGAIMKREADGIVIVDKETCLGSTCGVCQQDCPYDAPQFGPESDAKMQKCDLCLDRWIKGMKPVCVEACPVRALDAGPLDELESKYGKTKAAIGFAFSDASWPSLVLKAKDK